MKTPEEIVSHASDYKDNAWKQYTPEELASWVRLLIKRATHRTDAAKAAKDIADARNYYAMLGAHIDEAESQIL